jgi:hypothetical protein
LNSIKQAIVTMQTCCVFFEVQSECLSIIYMNVAFRWLTRMLPQSVFFFEVRGTLHELFMFTEDMSIFCRGKRFESACRVCCVLCRCHWRRHSTLRRNANICDRALGCLRRWLAHYCWYCAPVTQLRAVRVTSFLRHRFQTELIN